MDEYMDELDETTIDIKKIFLVLFKSMPVILIVTLVCGAAAYIYSSRFMTPVYSARVRLYVNNQQGDSQKVQNSDIATANSLVHGYVAMITTDKVLQEVASNINLDYSAEQLASMISAEGIEDTSVFVVTVRSTNPQHAQQIANVVAETAPPLIQDIVKGSTEIIDRASLPKTPDSPNVLKISLIGMIIGFAAGVVGVLLKDKFDVRVKSSAILTEKFDLPVLSEADSCADDPLEGGEAYKRINSGIRFSLPRRKCRVIGVTSAVNGEGKSFTASRMAAEAARAGNKTLLIDGDMSGHGLGAAFGFDKGNGLSNVIAGDENCEAAALHTAVSKNLDVITGGDIPPNPEELLASPEMKSIVEGYRNDYSYIIIDMPPVSRQTAEAAASAMDGIVMVVRARKTGADVISDALKWLADAGAKNLGFVFNDPVKTNDLKG